GEARFPGGDGNICATGSAACAGGSARRFAVAGAGWALNVAWIAVDGVDRAADRDFLFDSGGGSWRGGGECELAPGCGEGDVEGDEHDGVLSRAGVFRGAVHLYFSRIKPRFAGGCERGRAAEGDEHAV